MSLFDTLTAEDTESPEDPLRPGPRPGTPNDDFVATWTKQYGAPPTPEVIAYHNALTQGTQQAPTLPTLGEPDTGPGRPRTAHGGAGESGGLLQWIKDALSGTGSGGEGGPGAASATAIARGNTAPVQGTIHADLTPPPDHRTPQERTTDRRAAMVANMRVPSDPDALPSGTLPSGKTVEETDTKAQQDKADDVASTNYGATADAMRATSAKDTRAANDLRQAGNHEDATQLYRRAANEALAADEIEQGKNPIARMTTALTGSVGAPDPYAAQSATLRELQTPGAVATRSQQEDAGVPNPAGINVTPTLLHSTLFGQAPELLGQLPAFEAAGALGGKLLDVAGETLPKIGEAGERLFGDSPHGVTLQSPGLAQAAGRAGQIGERAAAQIERAKDALRGPELAGPTAPAKFFKGRMADEAARFRLQLTPEALGARGLRIANPLSKTQVGAATTNYLMAIQQGASPDAAATAALNAIPQMMQLEAGMGAAGEVLGPVVRTAHSAVRAGVPAAADLAGQAATAALDATHDDATPVSSARQAAAMARQAAQESPALTQWREWNAQTPSTHTTTPIADIETRATAHLQRAIQAAMERPAEGQNPLQPNPPARGHQFVLIAGLPGAGKSVAEAKAANAFSGIVLGADDAAEHEPGYENGYGRNRVGIVASRVNFDAIAQAAAQGLNIVYPTMGADPAALAMLVAHLQRAGYDIHVRLVDAPTGVAMRRAAARAEVTGRIVDPRTIQKVGTKSRENIRHLANTTPGIASYAELANDTDGQPYRVRRAINTPEWPVTQPAGLAGEPLLGPSVTPYARPDINPLNAPVGAAPAGGAGGPGGVRAAGGGAPDAVVSPPRAPLTQAFAARAAQPSLLDRAFAGASQVAADHPTLAAGARKASEYLPPIALAAAASQARNKTAQQALGLGAMALATRAMGHEGATDDESPEGLDGHRLILDEGIPSRDVERPRRVVGINDAPIAIRARYGAGRLAVVEHTILPDLLAREGIDPRRVRIERGTGTWNARGNANLHIVLPKDVPEAAVRRVAAGLGLVTEQDAVPWFHFREGGAIDARVATTLHPLSPEETDAIAKGLPTGLEFTSIGHHLIFSNFGGEDPKAFAARVDAALESNPAARGKLGPAVGTIYHDGELLGGKYGEHGLQWRDALRDAAGQEQQVFPGRGGPAGLTPAVLDGYRHQLVGPYAALDRQARYALQSGHGWPDGEPPVRHPNAHGGAEYGDLTPGFDRAAEQAARVRRPNFFRRPVPDARDAPGYIKETLASGAVETRHDSRLWSRLRRAVEDDSFGQTKAQPAARWLQRLSKNPRFAKAELDDTILPELQSAAAITPEVHYAGDHSMLTKADILALIDRYGLGVRSVERMEEPATSEMPAALRERIHEAERSIEAHTELAAHYRVKAIAAFEPLRPFVGTYIERMVDAIDTPQDGNRTRQAIRALAIERFVADYKAAHPTEAHPKEPLGRFVLEVLNPALLASQDATYGLGDVTERLHQAKAALREYTTADWEKYRAGATVYSGRSVGQTRPQQFYPEAGVPGSYREETDHRTGPARNFSLSSGAHFGNRDENQIAHTRTEDYQAPLFEAGRAIKNRTIQRLYRELDTKRAQYDKLNTEAVGLLKATGNKDLDTDDLVGLFTGAAGDDKIRQPVMAATPLRMREDLLRLDAEIQSLTQRLSDHLVRHPDVTTEDTRVVPEIQSDAVDAAIKDNRGYAVPRRTPPTDAEVEAAHARMTELDQLIRQNSRETGRLHRAMLAEQDAINAGDGYSTPKLRGLTAEWMNAHEAGRRLNAERTRIEDTIDPDFHNPKGLGGMTWRDGDAATYLAAVRALLGAIDAGKERLAFATAKDRAQLAHLQYKAGRYVYEQAVPGIYRRIHAMLGLPYTEERAVVSGRLLRSFKITPELTAAINRWGVPMLTLGALMTLPGAKAHAQQAGAGADQESTLGRLADNPVVQMIASSAVLAGLATAVYKRFHGESRMGDVPDWAKDAIKVAEDVEAAKKGKAGREIVPGPERRGRVVVPKGRSRAMAQRPEPAGRPLDGIPADVQDTPGAQGRGRENSAKLGLSPEGLAIWKQTVEGLKSRPAEVSLDLTKAEGSIRALDPERLFAKPVWTGADAVAGRELQTNLAQEAARLQTALVKLTPQTPEHVATSARLAAIIGDLADTVERATKERENAGRTLGAYRLMVKASRDPAAWLYLAQRAKRTPLTTGEVYKVVGLLKRGDQRELAQYVAGLRPTSLSEKIAESIRLFFLSSITTTEKITLSHLLNAIHTAVDHPLAVGLDYLMSAYGRGHDAVLGRNDLPVQARRTMAMAWKGLPAAYGTGFRRGVQHAGEVLAQGMTAEEAMRLDERAISGRVTYDSPFMRAVQRVIYGSHSLGYAPFHEAHLSMVLNELALVEAKRLHALDPSVDVAAKRAELLRQPTPDLVGRALDEARRLAFHDRGKLLRFAKDHDTFDDAMSEADRLVFQGHSELFARLGLATRNEVAKTPVGRVAAAVLLPFTTIPGNIAMRAVDATPLGLLTAALRQVGAPFDQRRMAQDLARVATGTGLLAALGYYLAHHGHATGIMPENGSQRDRWLTEKRQALSVKVGHRWFDIGSLGPQGIMVALGAEWYQLVSQEPSVAKRAWTEAATIGHIIEQAPYLTGLNNVTKTMTDPTRYGTPFLKSLAQTVVPAIVRRVGHAMDPYVRDTEGPLDAIQADLPVASRRLPPRLDAFGQPVKRTPGERVSEALSPTRMQDENPDPVLKELERLQVGMPGDRTTTYLNNKAQPATPEEKRAERQLLGPVRHAVWQAAITDPRYPGLSDGAKRDLLERARELPREAVAYIAAREPDNTAPQALVRAYSLIKLLSDDDETHPSLMTEAVAEDKLRRPILERTHRATPMVTPGTGAPPVPFSQLPPEAQAYYRALHPKSPTKKQ